MRQVKDLPRIGGQRPCLDLQRAGLGGRRPPHSVVKNFQKELDSKFRFIHIAFLKNKIESFALRYE
jgi:hypothetical protein